MRNYSFPARRISPKSWVWAFSRGSFWASLQGSRHHAWERPRRVLCHDPHRHCRCDRRRFFGQLHRSREGGESFDLGGIFIAHWRHPPPDRLSISQKKIVAPQDLVNGPEPRLTRQGYNAEVLAERMCCDFVVGPDDGGPRTPEQAEMLARVDPALDRPVILFQDVIEILQGAVLAVVDQMPSQAPLQFRSIPLDPSPDGDVIHREPTLGQ